jgi:hypothetical protein
MSATLEQELQEELRGVYPPSFCSWQLILVVMVITELSVVLISIGKDGFPATCFSFGQPVFQWLLCSVPRDCALPAVGPIVGQFAGPGLATG